MHYPTSLPVQVAGSVFQVLGLICTAWRIYFRLRIDRFWWEDAWAAVAMLFCLASLVGNWTLLLTYNSSSIVGYWLYSIGYTSVVRAAQLSILFSIIRIVGETRLGRFTYLCAACCGIFWIVILSWKSWQCASDPSWHNHITPACNVKTSIMIFESTSNCLMVGILIALPLRVLWRVKLPRRQRRMILSIFASSFVLALAAIFHVLGHVLRIEILIVGGINFEVGFSIIMCNLLVVVTYAYRYLRRDDRSSKATSTSETETDDFTQPTRGLARPSPALTGVEVNSSISTSAQYTTHISLQDNSVPTDSSV